MKQFGKIFKKFRESRGLKLKDISKLGISSSQLSRFEHGETDLTITKFMTALDEINMSIEEFMYAAHDFHRDELNELLEKVKHYVSNRDIIGLKNLLIFQIEKGAKRKNFHNLNTILIKIRLQDLSEENYYNKKDKVNLFNNKNKFESCRECWCRGMCMECVANFIDGYSSIINENGEFLSCNKQELMEYCIYKIIKIAKHKEKLSKLVNNFERFIRYA